MCICIYIYICISQQSTTRYDDQAFGETIGLVKCYLAGLW